jgi:hypothetical protein
MYTDYRHAYKMSSSYIPPHLRNRIKKAESKPLDTPAVTMDNFPSLSGARPVRSNAGAWGARSFASLAREWSDKAEDEKIHQNAMKEREQAQARRDMLDRKQHVSYHHYYEDTESVYDLQDYPVDQKSPKQEDDWTTVDYKKLRPELTPEQQLRKQELEEEEEKRQKQLEESVWNSDEWDYRDRRSQL